MENKTIVLILLIVLILAIIFYISFWYNDYHLFDKFESRKVFCRKAHELFKTDKVIKELNLVTEKADSKKIILIDHSDLKDFKGLNILKKWTDGIDQIKIPIDEYFGYCTILSKFYDYIRLDITQDSFTYLATNTLKNFDECVDQSVLETDILRYQKIFIDCSTINNISNENLQNIILLFELYLIISKFIENPEIKDMYKFREFYKLKSI